MSSGAPASDKKGIPLPPQVAAVRAYVDRARDVAKGLSRPARVLLGSTLVVALILGGWLFFRSVNEPYATLFTQLDRDDAAALVAKLKELKVPYHLSTDETSIEVPEARVHELRLELAQAGLPRGGGVGFESFDKMRLGATEFEQRVLYRRALEGELARTISSIAAVQSARVHLVLPEKSVFVSRSEPASASVVVKLRAGRVLSPGEIAGIVRLSASAVPGLGPERVTLVTTDGALLHGARTGAPNPDGTQPDGDAEAAPTTRTIESNLEGRARAMLERVLGPGHVDVRVSADVDLSRVEHQEDRYDPAKSALRSETASKEMAGGDGITAAGVPGAESNVPNGDATATSNAAASKVVRESHTRNFEIDHVSEKRVTTSGQLKRLTVAVVLDGVRPPGGGAPVMRSKEELDKVAALVRAAVGVDDKRGDVVTVESVPFAEDGEPALASVEAPKAITWATVAPKAKKYWKYGAAAGIFLLLATGFLVRRKKTAAAVAASETPLLAAEPVPTALPGAATLPKLFEPSPDVRLAAHDRAAADPATAALVLRYWLGTADATAGAAKKGA